MAANIDRMCSLFSSCRTAIDSSVSSVHMLVVPEDEFTVKSSISASILSQEMKMTFN